MAPPTDSNDLEKKKHSKVAAAIKFLLAGILVSIVLIIIMISRVTSSKYSNYLSGLWVGTPVFLKEAQLSDLQIFISPMVDGKRDGYLIITDTAGAFISNQAISIVGGNANKMGDNSALDAATKNVDDVYTIKGINLTYIDALPNASPPISENVHFSISILNGSLTIFDSKKIYAHLTKDLTTSAAAVNAYRGP